MHQNGKLLLITFVGNLIYHNLFEQLVCSTDNNMCMLNRCDNCPVTYSLEELLEDKISDEVAHIMYKQLVSTDRTILKNHIASPEEVIETLSEITDKLAEYHFIAKLQSGYLRNLKENIAEIECIMLLD